MKSILDPDFRYVPSFETDVRKTFERVRRELGSPGMASPIMGWCRVDGGLTLIAPKIKRGGSHGQGHRNARAG